MLEGGALLLAGANRVGLVKFKRPESGNGIEQAWLSLNFLYGNSYSRDITVYAYGARTGQLETSDLWTLMGGEPQLISLGTLHIISPAAGEDIYVDVSTFVRASGSPYLAFAMQSSDVDLLSSLEANHGHASQLILAQVPEPSEAALMFAGLLTLAGCLRRRAGVGHR